MQPTLAPQSTGAADDMDSLPAVESMDWLFKKERIYLLAQFWQQVSGSFILVRVLSVGIWSIEVVKCLKWK